MELKEEVVADQKDSKPAEASSSSDAPRAPEEPTYHVDRLIAEAQAFVGHPSHVVAGALHGEKKKHFTVDEVENLVRAWLKRPVETDSPETRG